MITTLIITFVLASIIIGVNPRHSSLRWLSASLYTASFLILVFMLDLKYPDAPHFLMNTMFFVGDVGLAYTFTMFGVVYSALFDKKYRRLIILSGFIVMVVVYLMTPLTPTRRINYEGMNELPVVLLVVISLTFGAVLLIMAYYKEKQPYKKIERLLTNLLVVPTMLYIAGSYTFYLYEIDLFQYNYMLAIGFLILFLTIGIKQGVLGVKIKIAMVKTDASMHLLKGGSSVLSHTIKNEIGKVDLLIHQMKRSLRRHEEMEELLDMATDSVHHIQTMMTKINERVQAIEVNLIMGNLLPITEQCIEKLERTAGNDVAVRRDFKSVPDVFLDPLHMKEVIDNILMNALESMAHRGTITVSLTENRKAVVLQIQDTGKGIPKHSLPYIFDPFYSTKNRKSNYGLGLFYCKNVMTKHHGSIHVESIEGRGSCFSIHLQK